MIEWRIYYEGGVTFSNEDGTPFDAPSRGVMVISVAEPAIGRQLVSRFDFYWWHSDKRFWFGGDVNGLWDYLSDPGPKKVLFGRFVKNDEYQVVIKQAIEDPDLPVKSARHPEEKF